MKHFLLALALLASSAWAREPSVLLYNVSRDRVEYSRNTNEVRAIASVTKIMTAMVTLDYNKDLGRQLQLSKRVRSNLPQGTYTRLDLLRAMLVRSDNAAAETLAEDYPGGRSAFIKRMNSQAQKWDMAHTKFEDPTGLGKLNLSTVDEVKEMMTYASGYWLIRDISTKKHAEFETKYKKKIKTISLNNTNQPLLFTFDSIVVSKTGLTSAAGWCVGLVVEQNNQQYVVVVLGAKNKADRIATVKDVLYNHILDQNLTGVTWTE
jgi:D-alanyl-D-alanine endopeptidase (penicillin-binding protein 7)